MFNIKWIEFNYWTDQHTITSVLKEMHNPTTLPQWGWCSNRCTLRLQSLKHNTHVIILSEYTSNIPPEGRVGTLAPGVVGSLDFMSWASPLFPSWWVESICIGSIPSVLEGGRVSVLGCEEEHMRRRQESWVSALSEWMNMRERGRIVCNQKVDCLWIRFTHWTE